MQYNKQTNNISQVYTVNISLQKKTPRNHNNSSNKVANRGLNKWYQLLPENDKIKDN